MQTMIKRQGRIDMRANAGFSLIEVMIAVLVLAVGILGAGALQTMGLQTTQGAYFRSQGIILAEDIVDRMRANRTAPALAAYVQGVPAIQPNFGCLTAAGGCTPVQMANIDMWNWNVALSALPGGAGVVVAGADPADPNGYVVTVSWNENEWVNGVRTANQQLSTILNVTIFPL